jgi:hypothetical protein
VLQCSSVAVLQKSFTVCRCSSFLSSSFFISSFVYLLIAPPPPLHRRRHPSHTSSSPHLTSPYLTPHLISPHCISPHLTALTSPHLHQLTSPHLTTSPPLHSHLTSPLTSPHLTSSHLTTSSDSLPSPHHISIDTTERPDARSATKPVLSVPATPSGLCWQCR